MDNKISDLSVVDLKERLFDLQQAFSAEGRLYLSNRSLSLPWAFKCGIRAIADRVYFIYSKNGEILRFKWRSMIDKKLTGFNSITDQEKNGFKMPFFNQQNWIDKDFLIITEGEFDCIALMQLIERNVVSLPNGSGSLETAFRNNYEYLQDYQTIYICTDMDEAGNLAANKAISMLSPAKYRRIILPAKDANEWIINESPISKEDLEWLMLNAQCVKNSAITNMGDLDQSVFEKIDFGIPFPWKNLNKILGGLRKGEVTVISADTGSGKSTFCMNLFYSIACQGEGVWINSYEMSYKVIFRKLASIYLKKRMKYEEFSEKDKSDFTDWLTTHNCFINEKNLKTDTKTLKEQFEIASLAFGIKYIFLDHLDYISSSECKNHTYENIDNTMKEIHSLALQFNVSVILVAHPKQMSDKEITMSDLKGSSGIKQYADNVLILTRMERFDPQDINRVKVRIWKNRLLGNEGAFFLRYSQEIDGYIE
jgi:twinkle protein